MLRRLVGTTPLDMMIVQFRNEKVSNHGSIPITIDCNVVAFIVFVEGFHQPTKRTKHTSAAAAEKINIQHFIPRCVKNSDISTYLKIFERQCEQVNIGEVDNVTHLLSMLPIDISHIILREPKDKLENYQHIKQVLLQRFKSSAESFRMKFTTHHKQPEAWWKDFAYELNNYLEGWLHSLEVKDFNSLKDLVLSDQLNKRVSKEVKEHFVDI
ncbi:CCHC-type domain-containing protein [Trichonephila clavipes]|nr:CCHC-type domain-containing protein [Trichonephila clavipes]